MAQDGDSQQPEDFKEQLRAAKKRARAEREGRERIADARGLLFECGSYATPSMAVHVLPDESSALLDERAGVAETLNANEEFCTAWVKKCWIPSVDAVLRVLAPEAVEEFEPIVPETEAAAGVVRVALRATHRIYCRLMRDRDAADAVIRDLADLRRELGQNRYVIQQVFAQMAGHVGREACRRSGGNAPSTSPESKASPSAEVDVPAGEPVRLSAPEIARRFKVPVDALRKALARYRRTNLGKGYDEVSDRGRKEPQYLYDLDAVRPIIEGVKERAAARERHQDGKDGSA